MPISAISSNSSMFQMSGNNPMAQMKQNFDDLGKALQSGNLDDARKAFAQLQKNAPSGGGDNKNPMSAEIASLSKALDSGDLKGAQEAYAKIQKKMSQGPPAGSRTAQGAPVDTVQLDYKTGSIKSSSSQSSAKTYDKKDVNKDGTVTPQEALEYELQHSQGDSSSSTTASSKDQGNSGIEIYA